MDVDRVIAACATKLSNLPLASRKQCVEHLRCKCSDPEIVDLVSKIAINPHAVMLNPGRLQSLRSSRAKV